MSALPLPPAASASLDMWVVYDHPADYPKCFVDRRWVITGARPTDNVITCPELDVIRDELAARGRFCLARAPGDDCRVVETWV